MTVLFEIHAATRRDHGDLLELARFLDSVNLPHDASAVAQVLDASEAAFSGAEGDPRRRQYVFVLRDLEANRAVGTSMVFGQLGRKDAPYIYLDVLTEEKYSLELDKHFVHKVLSMGYSFNGPTEIGGLVMHPDYRRSTQKLGMLISYVRFLWIKMRRHEFQDELLAELLPPLLPDGRSQLWEAIGRRFTNMTYREADRLSKHNKAFIRSLFPDGDIYVSLLSPEAQGVVGQVGPQTRGVEKLLRRIGFRYAERVDPFDGGPHFVAPTDEVSLVQNSAECRVEQGVPEGGRRAVVAVAYDSAPWFRAVGAPAEVKTDDNGERSVIVSPDVLAHLGLCTGDTAWVLILH